MAITFCVEIDWLHNGTWTDETSRTRHIHIHSGFDEPGGVVAAMGRCALAMDNSDQRFSPGYTSSPLYGNLLPRRQVRVSASDGVTTWTLFRGFVDAIIPDASEAGPDECLIACVDGIALLGQQRIGVAHEDTKAVDDAVSAVVSAAYTPPATSYADNGDTLAHYGRAWQPEQMRCLDALGEIAEAVYGRFYIARDGTATYLSRNDRLDSSVNPAVVLADYWRYIVTIRREHLIGYWRLNEMAGTTAYDSSGNERDGTVSGVTWGQEGVGDGARAVGLDGVNDYINVYSAGLASAFNSNAGTVLIWLKAEVWNDGTLRYLVRLLADSSNLVRLYKTNTGGLLFEYKAGGTSKNYTHTGLVNGTFYCVAITWDKSANEVKFYVNGAQVGTTQTGLGTWAGAVVTAMVGAANSVPTYVWDGDLAHMAIWDVTLTADEITSIVEG